MAKVVRHRKHRTDKIEYSARLTQTFFFHTSEMLPMLTSDF